ncbi:MAG: FkbM family methyltransferase [Opitutales bacterium]|nr:FkbM family methyltransferase [Opitutales bacterium]
MQFKNLSYAKYYAGILFRNWTGKRESYAQHGEDLLAEQLLGKVESFIDIGANDGVLFSNSYKFAKKGARGLCVEPSRKSFRKLKLNHLFHPKVRCIHSAASSHIGYLYLKEKGYESTLSQVHSDATLNSAKVRAFTLDELIRRHSGFNQVDLLSIDVEGHEESVLRGTQKPVQAKIIILETDKSDLESLCRLPALKEHRPVFTNGVNLIFTGKKSDLKIPKILPSGFTPC